MENEKKVETPKVEKTNKEIFIEKMEALVKETNHRIVAVPQFIGRDDGTFSVVVQYDVVEIKI